ncbi:hypothetical protein VM1G_05691 [Cytospora mali]|uniref:Uncharacterized protein n=1 Tax=Cytospora mali TaxID=578113 RepID=A0A194W3J0_CYTMA|nr:hypothetical protein VM1G_05691 [Valsa mali]
MTDPVPSPERQPSPGVRPFPALATPVAETSDSVEAEPLPPVHEEDEEPLHHHPDPQPQQPHPFQPLFTLVTDSTTRATHHPRVHYIFSDDDPDILTEALAQHSYQQNVSSISPSGSGTAPEERERPRQSSTASATITPSNERVIVLDLVPKTTSTIPPDEYNTASATATATAAGIGGSGYEVAWASSLSSDWAVVSARISPMADDINSSTAGANTTSDPDDENPQQQLILRIEGVGLDAVPPSSGPSHTPGTRARKSSTATATGTAAGAGGRRPSLDERDLRMSGSSGAAAQGQGQDKGKEDYASIIDEFDKRMGVLRRVVDAGLERQRKLAVDEERLGQEGLPSGTHTHDWGAVTGGGVEQGDRAGSTSINIDEAIRWR